jgi:hypothetical protein
VPRCVLLHPAAMADSMPCPALLQGGQPAGATGGNEITYIAWNRKVQHILASTSTNGSTVVWDLKRQRPVISFRDPNRSAAAWIQHDSHRWHKRSK